MFKECLTNITEKVITCFLPDNGEEANRRNREAWMACPMVHQVNVMHESLYATATLRTVADAATTPYTLLCMCTEDIQPGTYALQRMTDIAEASGADLLFAAGGWQQGGDARHRLPEGFAARRF